MIRRFAPPRATILTPLVALAVLSAAARAQSRPADAGGAPREASCGQFNIPTQLPQIDLTLHVGDSRVPEIVLEVLPNAAYRLNTQPLDVTNLTRRLHEVFDPRPIKALFLVRQEGAPMDALVEPLRIASELRLYPHVCLPSDVTTRYVARVPDAAPGQPGAPSSSGDRVYFEFQVEKPVRYAPGNPAAKYPDVLKSANVEGSVLAQFVVDTTGLADMSTFKVLKSAHDLFTSAVKDVLPQMRFEPATLKGSRVRQLVQMPFMFSISQTARPPR